MPDSGGNVLPFPVDRPLRTIRLDLEAEANLDLREVPHDFGDLRLTLRRADWSVLAELDAFTYEPENLDEPLDEEF